MRTKKWHFFIAGLLLYMVAILLIGSIEGKAPNSNIKGPTDALWYAIVTLTTVGYGDYFPVTPLGKIIGLLLIIGSIGVLGFVIGEITSRFNQYMEKKKSGFYGTKFENHYIIIGWNDFGRLVAEQILYTGHKVAFITNNKNDLELINDVFPGESSFTMFADYNNMEAYEKVNINHSKGVFVNFKEDTETLVFVLNLKKIFPKADIVVTCVNPTLKKAFLNAGIKHVVAQQEVTAKLVGSYIFEPHVAAYTEELIDTSLSEKSFDIQQYKIVEGNPYLGTEYLDIFIDLKKQYRVVLIGLVINDKIVNCPEDNYKIKQGDYFILMSSGAKKKVLHELFLVKEGE